MPRITLLTINKTAYAPARILEESQKANIKLELINYKDLRFEITGKKLSLLNRGKKPLATKGVFMRALGEDHEYNPLKYAVSSYFTGLGTKVINSRSFNRWPSLDKGIQHLEMNRVGITSVDTRVFGSPTEVINYYTKKAYFPVVAKDNVGSCGKQIFKLDNVMDLKIFLKNYNLRTIKTLLFQEFLPGAEDLRVIYLDGKILGAMKRIARRDSFLTNYSQGGKVEAFDLTGHEEINRIVIKVAKHFLLDYGGIDLMKDSAGNWVVLEINRACQFKGFEKSTGINVASHIVKYMAL